MPRVVEVKYETSTNQYAFVDFILSNGDCVRVEPSPGSVLELEDTKWEDLIGNDLDFSSIYGIKNECNAVLYGIETS